MPNNFRQLTLVILSALLLACHNGAQSQGLSKNIIWQSLAFTCTHQQDIWPKLNAEADAWHQEARALHKKRVDADQQIIDLYQQAADKNHIKAIANLGVIYQLGDGTPRDEAKAVQLAEQLIEMNVGIGYYQMANYLENGIGVEEDKKASLIYARKAADLGNPEGQYTIGKAFALEYLLTPMRDKALALGKQMLKCSLAQGNALAGYQLAYTYAISDNNTPKALDYFQKAAALGHSDSLFALQMIFKDGEYGVKKDSVRAACYERLGNEAGADKYKTFPNIDKICPLPPKLMPSISR